jgi:hypothetical protein
LLKLSKTSVLTTEVNTVLNTELNTVIVNLLTSEVPCAANCPCCASLNCTVLVNVPPCWYMEALTAGIGLGLCGAPEEEVWFAKSWPIDPKGGAE